MQSPFYAWFTALVTRQRRGLWLGTAVAVVTILGVAVIRHLLFAHGAPWFLFTPAVLLIALLLGTVPALVATALSAIAAAIAVVDPGQPLLLSGVYWIASVLFVATSAGLVGLVGALRITLRRLEGLVTEQATDRAALAEHTAFLSGVLASSTDCIKVLDLDGRLTFMSEGGQTVMEVSDFNQIAGCPWPSFWEGAGNAEAVAALEAAKLGTAASFIGHARTMAGTGKWWHVAVSPIAGPDGRPERILSVSRDITALRESEEQREHYVRIIEASSDFIGMARLDGSVFFLNDAGCRLVGLTTADLSRTHMADFFPPEQVEAIAAKIFPAVQRDGSWSGERLFRHFLTGELIPVHYTVFPVRDADGHLIGFGTVTRDIREQKRQQEQQAVINGEIVHRLKNTLAMVQAIAGMTLRKALPPEELQRFDERLQALARAHDLLHSGRWQATDLRDLATGAIESSGLSDRCSVSGPPVRLGARAAMSTSLLLHELATNAAKYGALSVPDGSVSIRWQLQDNSEGHELVLSWSEHDGPPAMEPVRKGFGTRLLSLGLLGTGGSDVRYDRCGFSATFRADADRIGQA